MKKIVLVLILASMCSAFEKSVLERIIQPRISYESSFLDDAKVSDTDGSVQVYKNNLSINNEFIGLSYTNWKFDWNKIETLPFGNGSDAPIDQIHGLALNLNILKKINDRWFLLTSLSLKSTFEKETKDSYGANLFSFASYRLDEDHSFQMGAFVNYHPTSTLALPVISYSYRTKFHDGWQLMLGFPRTHVGYHINEQTLVRLGMIYSQSLVRLSDTSPIEASGYVEAKDYMSNLGITYELTKNIKLSGDLLYTINREFIIYDSHANETQNNTIQNALGANVRLVYSFD
ncbi:MAG: hypothetical protein B7Y17_01070 [Sulfuricurvum sp. 24-42-5]|nr:MAG: hypothetical protein B7Y17_01070 [Sulfuricurvum sp. 24-42-5]